MNPKTSDVLCKTKHEDGWSGCNGLKGPSNDPPTKIDDVTALWKGLKLMFCMKANKNLYL